MKPKSTAEMKSFVKATRLPFIVKGVLSVHDAKRCMEAGVAGIVSGMDAYKCLALGADAVSVGRHLIPFIREGVEPLTNIMKAMTSELAGVMASTGVKSLKEMDPSVIHKTLF